MTFKPFLILFSFSLFSCNDSEKIDRLNDSIIENYDQIQVTSLNLVAEGKNSIQEINFRKNSFVNNGYHPYVEQKYLETFNQAEKIDKSTNEIIQEIEKIKVKLLESEGEKINLIATKKFNPSKIETIIPLDLRNIQHKNSTDAVNKLLISKDGQLSVTSKKLWKGLLSYRKRIITDLACYHFGPEKYSLSYKDFSDIESLKILNKNIDQWLLKSNINKDDFQVIKDIYSLLSFLPIKDQQWIKYSFKDIPITQAITNLTLLENKILQARNFAILHLKYRSVHCCYSFTEIKPLVSGATVIEQGDELKLKVLFAAFDEDKIPKIDLNLPNSDVENKFGYSIVNVKDLNKVGIQVIKGKISTKNNIGQTITKDWEWKVNVIPKK